MRASWRPFLPYLEERRLPDVIAAVQFMAAAPRPEKKIIDWTKDLSGAHEKTDVGRWTAVFNDHPEFFLVYKLEGENEPKAALRVRYANKLFDHVTGKEYTEAERNALNRDDPNQRAIRDRLTSRPLGTDAITGMMTTAIALHARASEERAARRWWVPILAAVFGFAGAVVGAFLGAHK
jgi:hypothetical protein